MHPTRERWRRFGSKVIFGRKYYLYELDPPAYFQHGLIWALPADALIGETRPLSYHEQVMLTGFLRRNAEREAYRVATRFFDADNN